MNGRTKILLVDDSRTALMMSQMILRKYPSVVVISAEDGEQAVRKAEAEKPDLILMDVVMPKMDGFEAVRRIRSSPLGAEIPIIMVTTRGEVPNVEKGFESGCNDYVMKPVDSAELVSKIRNYVAI